MEHEWPHSFLPRGRTSNIIDKLGISTDHVPLPQSLSLGTQLPGSPYSGLALWWDNFSSGE